MRKYSCSGPSVVKTRCTPLSPSSSSSSIDFCDRTIELLAVPNRCCEAGEDFFRKLVAQLPDTKNVDAEVLGSRPGYSILAEAAGDTGLAAGNLVQKSFTRSDNGCHGCMR